MWIRPLRAKNAGFFTRAKLRLSKAIYFNSMERLLRVNQLIKKELSKILLQEIDFPRGILATMTRVETSVDIRESKVYISVFPEKDAAKILEILNKSIYQLQQKLNKRLKMRPMPRIRFAEEKATAEAGSIEELLEKIHKKNERS